MRSTNPKLRRKPLIKAAKDDEVGMMRGCSCESCCLTTGISRRREGILSKWKRNLSLFLPLLQQEIHEKHTEETHWRNTGRNSEEQSSGWNQSLHQLLIKVVMRSVGFFLLFLFLLRLSSWLSSSWSPEKSHSDYLFGDAHHCVLFCLSFCWVSSSHFSCIHSPHELCISCCFSLLITCCSWWKLNASPGIWYLLFKLLLFSRFFWDQSKMVKMNWLKVQVCKWKRITLRDNEERAGSPQCLRLTDPFSDSSHDLYPLIFDPQCLESELCLSSLDWHS